MLDEQTLAALAAWPSAQAQLVAISRDLYETCQAELLGIYLHGSLAMGCFNPARSDVDLLAVLAAPLTVTQERSLAASLLHRSGNPYPVEISLCGYTQLHPWRHPAPFALHFSEEWRRQTAAALDAGHRPPTSSAGTDVDLAAHCTVLRHRGLRLAGAPVAAAIPNVPWPDYLDAIQQDVTWAAAGNGDVVYRVLNLCRVWAAVAEHLVLSKAEGAAWAQPQLPAAVAATVRTVLEVYQGRRPAAAIAPEQAATALAWLQQRLPLR